ncbi:MAG: HelD family protein [Actinomycetes bacterium]
MAAPHPEPADRRPPAVSPREAELDREQQAVTRLYERLDTLRDRTRSRLADIRRAGAVGTHQNRSERDSYATLYEDRLARLDGVENGLCFGRLDLESGERYHVGRLGMSDEDQHTMLVDWRAPAAQPFYSATAADPSGVLRRRHLRTRHRQVLDVADDVFDVEHLSDDDRATLGGDAALLAALGAHRTGRMRDIVATIQSEQDRVIRADEHGVLVVQGGPGTGKTAVALHRAAYLLYAHRERLARSGVLVVGPNPVFLRYIEQVLPSLGETGVVLSSVDALVPGVTPERHDRAEVAAVKADARMADVLAAAVAAVERVPEEPLLVPFEDHVLRLDARMVSAARRRARRSDRPHNPARYLFARLLLRSLHEQAAEALGDDSLRQERWVARALLQTEEFRAAVDALWPRLTAVRLVEDLFADRRALDAVAMVLSPDERALLVRPGGTGWSAEDVPLLDEAYALLGDPEEALQAAADRRRRRQEHQYAEAVVALTGTSGQVDPDRVAERYRDDGLVGTVAERAAGSPDWRYGHVIVDEAQELSPMAWRMLLRRCPSRSMTVVGDVAQTSAPWGATSWAEVLDPVLAGRWRAERLTTNYRTPAEIMALAAGVLSAVDPDAEVPTSVRETGELPWARRVTPEGLVGEVADAVAGELAAVDDGTVAVLVPDGWEHRVAAAVRTALPGRVGADVLEGQVSVLPVARAKGLEFDAVVAVEPARLAEGPRGLRDLYVALTRATRRLGVVHAEALPDVLAPDALVVADVRSRT